jgi:hypothetical protein
VEAHFSVPALASSPEQLERIAAALRGYLRLPFASDSIPGAFVETVLATMRDAKVLSTYDFVDVVDPDQKIGWQVKSTKAETPVTWKRAKIPDAIELMRQSQLSERGCRALGDAIIAFCNQHARSSMEEYGLSAIGYARVIITRDHIVYFERELVTTSEPQLFNPHDFVWKWSNPKVTKKKEQLPALHGTHKATGKKWWAWHGQGENQLHFSGERAWWPEEGAAHRISIAIPHEEEKIDFEAWVKWVSSIGQDAPTEE